jgi:hypothetical protein
VRVSDWDTELVKILTTVRKGTTMNKMKLTLACAAISLTGLASSYAKAAETNVPIKFAREMAQQMVETKFKEKGVPLTVINNTPEQYTASFRCLDAADGFLQKMACGFLDTRSGGGSGVSMKLDMTVRKGTKPNTTIAKAQTFFCVRNGLGIESCELQNTPPKPEGQKATAEIEWEKLAPEQQKPYLDEPTNVAAPATADPAILEKQIEILKLQLELAKLNSAPK